MISPKQPHLGKMLAYVGWPLLLLFFWDALVTLAYVVLGWTWIASKSLPLALYGSAIGVIVGFRNNSAYGRWWEARGLWGQIVNNSRSLARQVCTTITNADDKRAATQRHIVLHQIAYVHALRQQLRGLNPLEEVQRILGATEAAALSPEKNVALGILQSIGFRLREARAQGWIDGLEWQAMDRNLDDLADAQGGAERIKNTPMPKQYDYFPMLFVRIFCLLLPMGMVEQLGWLTPLGSTVVGFMFLALDKIGRDLENPFDNAPYDVPMTAIATTIEINLRQLIGETELPEPIQPMKGVIW